MVAWSLGDLEKNSNRHVCHRFRHEVNKPGALCCVLNTMGPRQNDYHFTDSPFKCMFLNGDNYISIIISLKFVPKGPINHITALVQIMAWRLPGAKRFSEPVVVRLSTYICVTRLQ